MHSRSVLCALAIVAILLLPSFMASSADGGTTDLTFDPSVQYSATVTPFAFPDSDGAPIYQTLDGATDSVDICIYELTSPALIGLLVDLEKRTGSAHVDVRVLLEAKPFGYDTTKELSMMKVLQNAGGEVRTIGTTGDADRYSYVHAKYALIDGDQTIITSENWTVANMGGSGSPNRGWGVVIDSTQYNAYMAKVFANDWSATNGDIQKLPSDTAAYTGKMNYAVAATHFDSFAAKVTPILSPDSSYDALQYYVEHANSRIYVEQLDLGSSYAKLQDDSPVTWLAAAADRGLDVRYILDASQSSADDHKAAVALINEKTKVKATTIDGGYGFSTTHNKGLILDDAVWVGSVNWTSNSFEKNRETATYIQSKEVADYFLSYFNTDWDANYGGNGGNGNTEPSTSLWVEIAAAIIVVLGALVGLGSRSRSSKKRSRKSRR